MRRRRSPGSPAAGPAGSARRRLVVGLAALVAVLATGTAFADPNGLSISGQWFRLITPTLPAAGYFTLSNATDTPQRLVGAASPGCGMLTLHHSVARNGEASMAMVPSVTIPGHGELRFAPGGYHLMCMSPTPLMQRGHSVPVTLRLGDGETVSTRFPVRGATGK